MKSVHIFWVYELLQHDEGLTASELAARSAISRSLISREISDLCREGYIEIDHAEHGRRKSYNSRIRLTDKGRELAGSICGFGLSIQKQADTNITEEELSTFYKTLEKLSMNLSDIAQGFGISTGDSPLDGNKSDIGES